MKRKKIDYFIVGAQKSGSTSVFNWMKSARFFDSHVQPEMSYFMLSHEQQDGWEKAWNRYFGSIAGTERPVLAKHAMAGYSEECLNKIKNHNHAVKVIFVMRNQIGRAYSAYWYARKMGWELADSFQNALNLEKERLEDYIKNRNLCYMYNSQYDIHLPRILDIMGDENVLILTGEDMNKGREHVMGKVFKFCCLDKNENVYEGAEDRFNEGGLPRSYIMAKIISYFLRPNNLTKRVAGFFLSPKQRTRVRDYILMLNHSGKKYPEISHSEQKYLETNLKVSIDYYKAYASKSS